MLQMLTLLHSELLVVQMNPYDNVITTAFLSSRHPGQVERSVT